MSAKSIRKDEAVKLLRIVTPDKAFHFYKGVGQPLGVSSRSLSEFAVAVKAIDPSSVRFHLERGDIENWLIMLGDRSLADQVGALRNKNLQPDELRSRVSSIVSARLDRLQKASA